VQSEAQGPWRRFASASTATVVLDTFARRVTPCTGGIIGATIYYLDGTDARQFAQFFEQTMLPHVAELGVQPIARLFTEEAPNDYPRLPVREHDRTFVWFARWANVRDEAAFVAAFSSLSDWRDSAPDAVLPGLMRKPERLRLLPTAGSALR
jgi:hypothetical protein